MRDEDLLQCPLLQSLDAMHRAELLGMLNSSNLRERLEKCIADRPHLVGAPVKATVLSGEPVDEGFEPESHTWAPGQPRWRRSAKE